MKLRSVGLMAVLALVVVSCGGGVPEASGPSEGIQVHGDWTIEVLNEDGSLDRSVHFSNDLTLHGANQLAEILSGNVSVGTWRIYLQSTFGAPEPCPSNTTWLGNCEVNPASASWTAGTSSFLLTGSVDVEADAQIVAVETRLGGCPPDVAPAVCTSGGSTNFTRRALDVADLVDVTAGQTVQVQVEISITSG